MKRFLTPIALLFAVVLADPAAAQNPGKGNGKNAERAETVVRKQGRPELHRRERTERRDDDRREDRYEDRWEDRDDDRPRDRREALRSRSGNRVPPGWCIGKGNPHNTPENCGYRRDGRYDDRYPDRQRSDDRYGDGSRRGGYEEAHREFHRYHDRMCHEKLAQRPLDPVWQVRVRAECKLEHDRWHARNGTTHRDY